jgi:diacylglycerol O-acyltransferase / trehalose O-mycolyltransferase
MRRHGILLVLLTLVVVTLGTTPVAVASAEGLHVQSQQRSGRLVEVSIDTPALASPSPVRILLPDGYDANPTKRYPVLYLLHGAADNYRWWTDLGEAERITAGVPVIVVMPDAGEVGWYSDWFNAGAGGKPEWETYHIGQLVPWVDETFRTEPSDRAIAGLSMGGMGAMSYAARHPGMFDAAVSFSGALDLNGIAFVLVVDTGPLMSLESLPLAVFGSKLLNSDRWRAHNPWDIAESLRGMHLAVYTGNGEPGPYDQDPIPDPLEFFVHDASESFHNRLEALGIQHTYLDYGPGTHIAPYWSRDLEWELPAIMKSFGTD